MREMSGQNESFPNMALRQNQLWFPVTSLIQYVQHKLKGGQDNGVKAQRKVSEIVSFAKIDDPFLTLHCDTTRDSGAKSDNANLDFEVK